MELLTESQIVDKIAGRYTQSGVHKILKKSDAKFQQFGKRVRLYYVDTLPERIKSLMNGK